MSTYKLQSRKQSSKLTGINNNNNKIGYLTRWALVCECVSTCMRVSVCVSFSLKSMPHVSPALGRACWREGRLHSGSWQLVKPIILGYCLGSLRSY